MTYKNSSYYARTRKDFYNEHLFPKDFKRYCDFEKGREKLIKATKTISFKNIPFGENESKVIKTIGEPRFVIAKPYALFPIKVLFYREQLNSLQIVSQLHFFEDRFFYACYSVLNWTNEDLINYKEIIINKYSDGTAGTKQKTNKEIDQEKVTTLIDEKNNQLIINSDVYLQFIYYSSQNEIANHLYSIQIAQANKKLKQQQIAHDYF